MGNDLVDLVWAEFSPFKGDYRVQLIITLRRPSDTRRNTRKCHEHISWPDDCFWWLIGGYFQLCLHITDHFLTQSQKACRLLFSNRELLHVTRCVNHDIWSPTCFIEINIWRFCWRLLFKDGKRVLFWRSDCCLCFRPTTLGLRGPCTACCLGRTCRWPTKEACGRQTACLEGECSKEAPICLYLTSFLVHMCADGNPPPPPRKPHSDLWLDLFHTLLNIPDSGSLPSLRSLRCRMNTVLQENYGNKLPTLKSRLVVLLLENRKTVRR